jgi:hypothetical protein
MISAKTVDTKGTRILAKSLFRELRENGYSPNQILGLSTELIDLVTRDLKGDADLTEGEAIGGREGGWRAAI